MRKLTVKHIEAELKKPRTKRRKVTDGEGLFLEIPKSGNGRWRFKYRWDGKEKLLSLGVYPAVGLKDARDKHQEMRRIHASGLDPGAARKETQAQETNTFEKVALEWHAKKAKEWDATHAKKVLGRLERWTFALLGSKPVDSISSKMLLDMLKRIEDQGKLHTAHKVLSYCSAVFNFAIQTSMAEQNPAVPLKGALVKEKVVHRASITNPVQFAELLRRIDKYTGRASTVWALQLLPLVFVRPAELRKAEWTEIDFKTSTWTIPAEKMKMRRDHVVPLARQAMVILQEAQQLNGKDRYVFPALSSNGKPISENTLNHALHRMGYTKEEVCSHGFRASARTLLDEVLHQRPELIEHQLAHAVKGPLGRAYNRAEFLKERREMMQTWADYLDGIKEGAQVIPLRARER